MGPWTGALAWPWWGRSLPKGNQWGVLVPWTGAQCGQAPSPPATPMPLHPMPAPWCPHAPTPLTAPWFPWQTLHPQCPLKPLHLCWSLSPYTPCQLPMYLWHPYTLCQPSDTPDAPTSPAGPWCPLLPCQAPDVLQFPYTPCWLPKANNAPTP